MPVPVEETKETQPKAADPVEEKEVVPAVVEASETPIAAEVPVSEPEAKPEVEKAEVAVPAESEAAPELKPVEEPARPSTPPPKEASELEVPSLPATPTPAGKVNGHARSATTATGMGMITPPASAPSTPKKAMSLAESDTAASPPPLGSDKRKKRLSFFGKIKAKLSPGKEKVAGSRRSSLSPSSPLSSPAKKA